MKHHGKTRAKKKINPKPKIEVIGILPCRRCGTHIDNKNMYASKSRLWATQCPKCGRTIYTKQCAQWTVVIAIEEWNKRNVPKKNKTNKKDVIQ